MLIPRLTKALAATTVAISSLSLSAISAKADGTLTATPPPDAKALVAAPTDVAAPVKDKSLDGTTLTLSAGGQLATGNSRLLAGTANGDFETRFNNNGIGASLLANYGEGAVPGADMVTTAENAQARFRYDRFVSDPTSVFLINTFRHDRFQGLELRYNLDPGLRYLVVDEQVTSLWGELGYDFQADARLDSARGVLDPTGKPVLDPMGQPELLSKTATDHSARLFAGFRHAFNDEVTFSTGLEYLQSFIDSTRYRLNYDALFAAKVSGGLALGIGFSARYDHDPLPGKENLDTATTLSLIYSHSDTPAAGK